MPDLVPIVGLIVCGLGLLAIFARALWVVTRPRPRRARWW